ncbi:MAG: NAD(P)H-dependent oxidoreductase subunit E [Sphingopyxis terrae]|nr:NAD(P)H-dependent oxidoreductase subunit E [Sphingopyxis terrae]
MADAPQIPDEAEVRARWGAFAWTKENAEKAKAVIARYPAGRQRSAVMPLLDLAQRQVGAETQTQGWLPVPVIEYVAAELDMPFMRAYEVATFYGTTPCLLRGSDDVMAACKNRGMTKGKTTPDGLFTLTEVECMGTCTNAPMVQINDDNYEDLDYDSMTRILEDLAAGKQPKAGTQNAQRHTSDPEGGPTTLKDMVKANHDYRKEW